MSHNNNKVMGETSITEDSNSNNNSHRIQTRRTSRSARSVSPVMADEVSSPVSSVEETTMNASNEGRVTRSQSVESSGYETTDSRKRKRKGKNGSNKKRAGSYQPSSHTMKSVNNLPASGNGTPKGSNNEDSERETRNTTQRISKEARDAKKAQRDKVIKERLNELDKLEKAVKDGSHSEYHKLLSNIEQKRKNMLHVAEMRRSLAEINILNFFDSQKNAAYSQFYWDKLALRRSMIQHVQHKINTLEQEYYSNHPQSSLDDEHLSEWVPPDRPAMISSLTLGLSEEDAENDVEWAKQDPIEAENTNSSYPPRPASPPPPPTVLQDKRESSPPLDMLASLADRQYQKDFQQEPTEKSFTLPPLNPWRYDQRPTLPT
ncbi:hypothetical protein BDF21DRAFT_456863 [Thamnidium elegans]|nr:hypothetical protein BDF21DRAFT_456863 [Thamnidium elegans]